MKKIMDLRITGKETFGESYVRLTLCPAGNDRLPALKPGQFVNVSVPGSKTTFLRRPISINSVDFEYNELKLLIRIAGDGTRALADSEIGDILDIVLPLGNSFPLNDVKDNNILLIGGGVGVAPLLYYGEYLRKVDSRPEFLLGARTVNDLLLLNEFENTALTHTATEDGSRGTKGFVTAHDILDSKTFDIWVCCGPAPMMKAVAKKAEQRGVECFVSLENMMACGVGACLCCVEKTVKGNVCVCTEGPVFNIKDLTW